MGASGPHKGITREQLVAADFHIPWEVVIACISGEADPTATYLALTTTIDTHGCLDLLDLAEIRDSWTHAARRNAAEG